MEKYLYLAVFHQEEVGYSVEFPDLPGCYTQGDTLEEAYEMAKDAMGIYIASLEEDGEAVPEASEPKSVSVEGDDFAALIELDMVAYRQQHDNRAVKKTLTIPQWLNTMAERDGINFSSVLQSALKERLGVEVSTRRGKKKI